MKKALGKASDAEAWGFTPCRTVESQLKLEFLPLVLRDTCSTHPLQRSGLRLCSLLCRLPTSPPRSRALRLAQSGYPDMVEVSQGKFDRLSVHLPNLPPRSLMTMEFAASCPLVRPGRPHIRFLSIRSRFCSMLPLDPTSRRRPCISLTLRSHQAG